MAQGLYIKMAKDYILNGQGVYIKGQVCLDKWPSMFR